MKPSFKLLSLQTRGGRALQVQDAEAGPTTQHYMFAAVEMCYGREVVQPAVETETTTQHSTDAVMALFAGIVVNAKQSLPYDL